MWLRRREQFMSVSRGHDVASRAIKETESELGFELWYQHAESRGSNEECFRCSRETAMLRDQLKCSQLPGAEFHCYDSINEGRASRARSYSSRPHHCSVRQFANQG